MMKKRVLANPHDKFFKESFGRKEIALSFIKEYLPTEFHAKVNYETLTLCKTSYIDKELSEHFSDILYRIKIGGKNGFIYLLFEHKSYADRWTAFQLLRNMVKIWEEFFKQHKKIVRLLIIVPIVIYHGKEVWKVDKNVVSLFDALPEAQKYIPVFTMEVFDISHIPDEKIKGEVLLRAHLLLLKYIFNPHLIEKVPGILGVLKSLSDKTDAAAYLEVMLRYLFSSVESSKGDSLKHEIKRAVQKGEIGMPTIADELIKQGKLQDAEKMIQRGMSTEDIHDITGLRKKEIEALRKKVNRADKS